MIPDDRTLEALKSAALNVLRPNCRRCEISEIYKKYNRFFSVNTTDVVKALPDYTELEASIIDF